MKVLQINAIYEKFSTGRSTKELHEAMLEMHIEAFVACPNLMVLKENSFQIGNKFDWKLHSLFSRLTGKQGHFSKKATKELIEYIEQIKPDIIHLRNFHSNYINISILLEYIAEKDIATVITLHDCWFFTGKCNYYVEYNCSRWLEECGKCPALRKGNPSWFFDFSSKLLLEKKILFSAINRLAVIGVSQWVTNDAAKSILKKARIIHCIYNWIDLERFKPQECSELRVSMNLMDKFIILGIAMSWNKQKGIDIFNDLAGILSDDFQIILIGDDSFVYNKSSKIRFLGTIQDVDKLAKLYAMADLFMNPTIQETFGKTTAEALASGTPVVGYNGTATPELVGTDGKCGYLVNKNQARMYKDVIFEVKAKGKDAYAREARSRAEQLFSKDKNIKEYINIYKRLISLGSN